MSPSKHILVLRFSALGDVAMTVPVLKNLLRQHEELALTVVSRPQFAALFQGIERLRFYPADVDREYRGMFGLLRLARRIRKEISFDAVADLHDSVRTKWLRLLLGKPRAVIDKGRKERKELTRRENKILRPLRSVFQRYADVFSILGFSLQLDVAAGLLPPPAAGIPEFMSARVLIGLAPFAKHNAKMYPLEKTREVLRKLSAIEGARILLFGSRDEAGLLAEWEKEFPQAYVVAGKFDLAGELALIARLHVMVSMDSANMHLASLYGVPVVSIWGGTHPFAGFYGWGQSLENAVQADLPCRPSSIFGNRDCPVHGRAGCMQSITPEQIAERVLRVLRLS